MEAAIAQEEATWLEPVLPAYRKKRAWIALGLGLGLGGALLAATLLSAQPEDKAIIWSFIVMAIGVWRYRAWLAKENVRRYATARREIPLRQRIKRGAFFWSIGLLCPPVLAAFMLWLGNVREGWPVLLYLLAFNIPAVGIYLWRYETVLTPEAAKAQASMTYEDQQKGQQKFNDVFEHIFAKRIVRYPLAAFFLWIAVHWLDDPKGRLMPSMAMVVLALIAAWDVALWLLLAGLVIGGITLVFHGIAALPVSAAIVIGALIIASAIKK